MKEENNAHLEQANLYLNAFAEKYIPLIAFCKPQIIALDATQVQIKMPLIRETQNHLHSMYFGALAIGADLAGGFLAMQYANDLGIKISLAFKGVAGEFFMRPEADVVFVCNQGEMIFNQLQSAEQSKQRINQKVKVDVLCPSLNQDEIMASFILDLSIKVL